MAVGAEGKLVDVIAERMLQERVIRPDRAEAILGELRSQAES